MSHVYWENNNSGSGNNWANQSSYGNHHIHSCTHQLIREELLRANKRKGERIMELLSPRAMKKMKGFSLREKLMLLLEIILADLDKQIEKKIRDLHRLSSQMKSVTRSRAERKPGELQGMNLDSSVELQKLTMLVQKRQRLLEGISNALKSMHDADMNSVRRIV